MNELALFAGIGGGILAGNLLGWRTVCAVEIDDYRRRVLMQRQDDGLLDPFPIWPDIRDFDGRPWARCVDIVSGGFPCQDISCAGRGVGINGARSGLWGEMARVIREVRPRYVLVENSPALTVRGLGRVLGDLATLGFDAEWGVLGADDVGAAHIRKRIWIVADAYGAGCERAGQTQSAGRIDPLELVGLGAHVSNAEREQLWHEPRRGGGPGGACQAQPGDDGAEGAVADAGRQRGQEPSPAGWQARLGAGIGGEEVADADGERRDWRSRVLHAWSVEPRVGRVVARCPARVDRLAALGDAQVPAVAALAWRVLSRR